MKILFSLSLVMVIVTKGSTQEPSQANCQLSTVLQIDGHAEEWPMIWIDNSDKKVSYNVCSDDVNLYIRMKTKDDLFRRKIGLFGLTVWMDANGKKKKKLGLRFPSGVEAEERMESLRALTEGADPNTMTSTQRADLQKEVNKKLIADLEILELIGLADDPLTSTRSGITNGIKVAIASDDEGAYVYEALIPFKSFRLSKPSIPTLGIGFETGKYTPPPTKTPAGGSSVPQGGYGGSGSGYGGGYSGAMSRGFGGSGGGSGPMSSSSSLWVTVKMK